MAEAGRKRKFLPYLLVLLLIVVILAGYLIGVRKDMSDFAMYYRAGERIRQGETLYRLSDGHLRYLYPPASAAFFAAFTFLPLEAAKFLWYCLEFVALYVAFFIFFRVLPQKEKTKTYLATFSLLILAKFLGREIELGQINLFIICLLGGAFVFFLEEKPIKAGMLWAMSLFFKPYALVFLPYFALKRKLKLIGTGGIILLLGLAAPLLFYGVRENIQVHKDWFGILSESTPGLLTSYDAASLCAFIFKIFPGQQKTTPSILLLVSFFISAVLFLWMLKLGRAASCGKPEILEVAFLLLLIPLFSPLGWYYNYLYSLLAVMIILESLKKFPLGFRVALIVNFVVIAGSLKETLGRGLFSLYTSSSLVSLNFLLVLFGLFFLRIRKYW